jgi:tetraacyldisaccharide 4'-kinase
MIAFWRHKTVITYLLLMPSWLFGYFSRLRRWYLTRKYQSNKPLLSTKIVVIGNISVGGNGKTPFLIALAKALMARGKRVGVVSRGFGSTVSQYPALCDADSDALVYGDEPVMIAKQTGCLVMIDPNRNRAIQALLAHSQLDLILSDDGLQHYAMARDFEIAVVGSLDALGNQCLLPAGPLREPISRLTEVDLVVGDPAFALVQYPLEVKVIGFYELNTDEPVSLQHIQQQNKPIVAVSGIALPERFHRLLTTLNIIATPYEFSDHHQFKAEDFIQFSQQVILMTEKDAIKCRHMKLKNAYYLRICIDFPDEIVLKIIDVLGS